MSAEPNVSVNWNGITYTAHANTGAKFGTGTGGSEDEAREAALKDLEKDPDRTPPEGAAAHSTGTDPKAAAKAAGRTGS